MQPKEEFMRAAIEEALTARANNEHAIGAVIVKDGQIIARAPNSTRTDGDPTQHAEVAVIRKAVKMLGSRHLLGCVMYTTHEPCPMCSTAAVWARLKGVVVGASIEDMDEHRPKNADDNLSWRTIAVPAREIFAKGDPKVEIVEGFMRAECVKLFN